MLNNVAVVTNLQSVKRIRSKRKAPLVWEKYLEMWLSACSDYDKSHNNAQPAQHNINATNVAYDVDYD
jgi:hypothetical protein